MLSWEDVGNILSTIAKGRAFLVIDVYELAHNFATERAVILSVPRIKIAMNFGIY